MRLLTDAPCFSCARGAPAEEAGCPARQKVVAPCYAVNVEHFSGEKEARHSFAFHCLRVWSGFRVRVRVRARVRVRNRARVRADLVSGVSIGNCTCLEIALAECHAACSDEFLFELHTEERGRGGH